MQTQFIKHKSKTFWLLNVFGWMGLNFVYIALYYRDRIFDPTPMFGLSLTYLIGFCVSILMREFYKRIREDKSISVLGITIILTSLVSSAVWYLLDRELTILFNLYPEGDQTFLWNYFLSNVWSHGFVLMLWSALYFSINLWNDWGIERIRAEKADALAHSAQLQMLRYQLNPHFLFNSLNSIRALIDEDKIRAKSMVTELSEFLRYSLISKDFSEVPLRSELDAIRHYLEIEKSRYEEKLIIKFDIDEDAEEYPVLSFLIHPLVENAIKYGMKTSNLPLEIELSAKLVGKELTVSVENSGSWYEHNDSSSMNNSTGTGLENVKQRLENAFPDNHNFLVEKLGDSVKVIIKIVGNHK